jgi:hypothetical protein
MLWKEDTFYFGTNEGWAWEEDDTEWLEVVAFLR